jgi:CheY-like chemotaxis protein
MSTPTVYTTPSVLESCRIIRQRAREAHYPLVLTATQMKLVQQALRLAIEDAIEAMSDESDGRHEIQPDIDAYNQIHAALKQAKEANMGGRSEEGTSVEL